MKKVTFLMAAVVVAVMTSVATVSAIPGAGGCGVSQCGGGNDKCCTKDGATYYMMARLPIDILK
jgi:hypothetical protein